jgi:hypothetical protein
MIVPKLKSLTSTDFDVAQCPVMGADESFCVPLRAIFGSNVDGGEESFDFMVCNPKGLENILAKGAIFGRHYIFVQEYRYDQLKDIIEGLGRRCMAENWKSAAEKLARYGLWEFEDFKSD